jgi:mRNA interferase RelE/StbE
MSWDVSTIPEADDDIAALDGSVRRQVQKAIRKIAINPLPREEGGLGEALRNTQETKLVGLCKVKLRGAGLRIVYALKRTETTMTVVVVGVREGLEVYREAERRRVQHKF